VWPAEIDDEMRAHAGRHEGLRGRAWAGHGSGEMDDVVRSEVGVRKGWGGWWTRRQRRCRRRRCRLLLLGRVRVWGSGAPRAQPAGGSGARQRAGPAHDARATSQVAPPRRAAYRAASKRALGVAPRLSLLSMQMQLRVLALTLACLHTWARMYMHCVLGVCGCGCGCGMGGG
jgi:hypothetical protein